MRIIFTLAAASISFFVTPSVFAESRPDKCQAAYDACFDKFYNQAYNTRTSPCLNTPNPPPEGIGACIQVFVLMGDENCQIKKKECLIAPNLVPTRVNDRNKHQTKDTSLSKTINKTETLKPHPAGPIESKSSITSTRRTGSTPGGPIK
jgi:hypothetical protein